MELEPESERSRGRETEMENFRQPENRQTERRERAFLVIGGG